MPPPRLKPPTAAPANSDQIMEWAALVPELYVMDFEKSLAFYTDVLGFEVAFSRPEERFAYLQLR